VIDLGLVMIGLPFLLVPNWEGPLTNKFCLNGQDLSLNIKN